MKKLLIVKTGSTFPSIRDAFGDFEDFIADQIPISARDILRVPVFAGEALPAMDAVSAVIITGSHSMVSDREPWCCELLHWLRHVCGTRVPVLGICFGHQAIAAAWGGEVDYHPRGREVGTVEIELTEEGRRDPLLGCMPERFPGHVFHAQTVSRLPAGARVLAGNPFERTHAFVIHDHIWGVQFHPEFTDDVVRAYIEAQGDTLALEGLDPLEVKASVEAHPFGGQLLRRFADLI